MKNINLNKRQIGMTLVEAIIVLTIYSILSFSIMTGIAEFYQFNAYTLEQADEVENARRGMTQWNRDAKELTNGEDGAYPIAVIDEYTFGYYSDTDTDGQVEYVKYILEETTLRKFTYNATGTPITYDLDNPDTEQVLSLYVQNINQSVPTFQYFDAGGLELASTSPVIDVRYIRAQFIINIDLNRSPGEFMLRSSIAPRNLKDNL
jgi:type II secretory pathway pseudopilin PulG